ncbi:MAG TPA: protein kinase [Vicinamibacteria bacterium]|nr:protein kinase [Vicinamibacteria bacterium]
MDERDADPTGPLTDLPRPRRGGAPSLGPGHVLAERFKIVSALGEGGMGEVYEAEDLELGERVALKVLRSEQPAGEDAFDLFRREIQLARRVTHVNVCRTYDLFRHRGSSRDGRPMELAFVTMELLRGDTLAERVLRAGRLGTAEARPIVEQIVSGLAAAHHAGVVHRDLKAGNVILVPEGGGVRAVVSDFGLAHAPADAAATSPERRIVGTPAYMAPEQVEGRPATPATDVYALGVVMYEMVTGHVPFAGETPLRAALRRLESPPTPPTEHVPGLDPRWVAAIDRCLRRDPRERFGSVEDVARCLRDERRAPIARRRFVAALAAAAVAAAALYLWRGPGSAGPKAPPPLGRAPRRAVAVLAVAGPSDAPSDAVWLGEYLAEAIDAELGMGGALRLVPGDVRSRAERERAAGSTPASWRDALGADLVVAGAWSSRAGRLSVALRALDAASGAEAASAEDDGPEGAPWEAAERAARRLRGALGVPVPSEAERSALLAARFSNVEAARDYGAGLRALRLFDALAARAAFERAVANDPSHPLVRAALARALSALGLDDRARKEAQRALDLSGGLTARQRLAIEAQLREASREWPRVVAIRQEQRAREPDDVEHVVALADGLVAAASPEGALAALAAAGPPVVPDPRLAMAEARAALGAGQLDRARDAVGAAVALARQRGAGLLQARARLLEAQVLRTRGELEAAVAAGAAAAELFEAEGDRASVARALRHSADVRRYQGQLGEARRLAERGLAVARSVGDVGSVSAAVNRIASVLQEEGRLEASRQRYEEVRSMAPDLGDRELEATAMNNIGVSWWLAGNLVAARRQLEAALVFFRQAGSKRGLSFTLFNLGFVLLDQGELDDAARAFSESESLSRELTQPSLTGMAVFGQGQVALARGDAALARRRHEEALELRRGLDERGRVAESQIALAAVSLDEARLDDAAPRLEAALAELARQPRRDQEALARGLLAELLLGHGRLEEARREADRATALATPTEFRTVQTAVAITAARVQARWDAAAAALAAGAARERAEQAGHVGLAFEARLALGEIERGLGRSGAREALRVLAEEARTRGFGRVARRATSTAS